MPVGKGPTNKVTMSLGNLQVGNRREIWESRRSTYNSLGENKQGTIVKALERSFLE